MKIVVCEDEHVYQVALQQSISLWQQATGHTDVEIAFYSSSEELLEQFERKMEVDLFFIDIQIPGELNGIDLARKIRETNLDVTIVFCTNYNEYVYDGYTVNALRFLQKPVVDDEIFFCCNYVYNRLIIKSPNSLVFFSSGRRFVLRYAEIKFLEIKAHHLFLSTTIQPAPFKINTQLMDIMSELPKDLFVMCHRSYAVNIAHVRMLTRTECLLLDNESIPISRTYMNEVNQAFDRYHQGRIFHYGMDDI